MATLTGRLAVVGAALLMACSDPAATATAPDHDAASAAPTCQDLPLGAAGDRPTKPGWPQVVGAIHCLDYDGVVPETSDRYVVTIETYRRHLQAAKARGFAALTMAQALAIADGKAPWALLPDKPLLLFSDVTAQAFADHAAPILRELGYRATIGLETAILAKPWAMSIPTLKGLEAEGFEIASHSHSHADLTTLSPAQLEAEVDGARAILQGHGFAAENYIYPLGAWNAAVVARVQAAGHKAARATGAPDIRGGGFASFDPSRRFALGCALPVATSKDADVLAYLDDRRIEVEDAFVALADGGKNGPIEPNDFEADVFRSLPLHDAGDSVRVRFLVRRGGSYHLRLRVKRGTAAAPTLADAGYRYHLDGVALTHRPRCATVPEPNLDTVVWGEHDLGATDLDPGWHDLVVTALTDWSVVIDWLDVSP